MRKKIQDILTIVGYEAPVPAYEGTNWEYWKATYTTPGRGIQEKFLFLRAACNWTNLEEAAMWLRGIDASGTTVLVRSLFGGFKTDSAATRSSLLERIRRTIGGYDTVTLGALLQNTLRRALGASGSERISGEELGLQYFVDPSVHLPDRIDDRDASNALLDWLEGRSGSEAHVAVLLAPAGVGKTTLSEELFRRQANKPDSWPLVLKSDQWIDLASRSGLELEDIWQAAIRDLYPHAVVASELVEHCLASGAICPIFDGLDELCSSFPGEFDTNQTIQDLVELFTDGRVLLTSRAQFWQENVAPAIRKSIFEIELRPFSNEQRARYLTKRFPNDATKQDRAQRILGRIAGKVYAPADDIRIDALPYVVMLAAESADTDKDEVLEKYGNMLASDDPLEGLLTAFCARERGKIRKLTIDPMTQVKVFETLTLEYGSRFTGVDLDLVLEYVGVSVRQDAFREHALLWRSRNDYGFKFDFVVDYFLARVLSKWVVGGNQTGADRALAACLDSGGLIERAVSLIDSHMQGGWAQQVRSRWKDFSFQESDQARRGFLRLILGLARQRGKQVRNDATDALLEMIGDPEGKVFHKLAVSATVSGFDFRGVTFVDCAFRDLEWAQCSFNDRTVFQKCRFDGRLSIVNCDEFGAANFPGCALSPSVRGAIQSAQGNRRVFPITEEQIVDAVYAGLRKSRAGALGFKSHKVDGFFRGEMRQVPFAREVYDALVMTDVFELFESHGNDMYKVKKTTEAQVFLNNRLPTGAVKDAIERLRKKLIPAG